MTRLTRSEYFRFRTGTSGLTDSELLLLDRFFDGESYPLNALYEEDFAWHANLPFSHGLSDADVLLLLARWLEDGWLTDADDFFDADVGPVYTLTPKGGAVWESEWNPPWDSYCITSHRGPVRFGRREFNATRITSSSRKTAEVFFRTCLKCHWFDGEVSVTARSRKTRRLQTPTFVPWKAFPQVYEFRFFVRGYSYRTTDWETYEAEKYWWLSPYKLAKLRLERPALAPPP